MTFGTDQNSNNGDLSATSTQFLAIKDAVMIRWEAETRLRVKGADILLSPMLTNTLPAFLENIAESLSANYPRNLATSNTNAAAVHGGERARTTHYGPGQVIQEYQILRESIMVEATGKVMLTTLDWAIIDESINSAVREAVQEFFTQQDKLRRTVAAALSHDMRTPLSVVSHGAHLIQTSTDIALAHQIAGKISSSATRLSEMMGELLNALTINIGEKLPLNLSEFDMSDLTREVCLEYSKDTGAAVEANAESTRGYWCRSAVRRALENLLNNAIKYGDGNLVNIASKQQRGRLILSVTNTGNPIEKSRIETLFEQRFRPGASHSSGGWGIGLPFVKRVAESHGGSVAIDSSEATGTAVLIDIPVDCRPFVHPV